jgi:hypothetical protein
MTVVTTRKTDTSQNNGLLNCRITVQRIFELLDLEEEDEYGILRPTAYGIKTAIKLMIDSYDIMGDRFPKGSPGTDDQGNITIEWTSLERDRTIRLFCPFNSEQSIDIYHHSSTNEYAVEDIISVSSLVNWLNWFNAR